MTDDPRGLPKPIAWAKLAALVVVGLALATSAAMVLRARQRGAREEQLRAVSRERAREHEDRRRACSLADGSMLVDTDNVEGACQREVLGNAKAPSLVAFPGMFDEDGAVESPDGCQLIYRSWAAEPDERGVSVRRRYVCTFDPRTGSVAVEFP